MLHDYVGLEPTTSGFGKLRSTTCQLTHKMVAGGAAAGGQDPVHQAHELLHRRAARPRGPGLPGVPAQLGRQPRQRSGPPLPGRHEPPGKVSSLLLCRVQDLGIRD